MDLKRRTFNCNGRLLVLERPLVMGILNLTTDSFFDGGSYRTEVEILRRCENILNEGGDIIDIGAVSTRPGAQNVSETEERNRLLTALSPIRQHFPDVLISIDTYRAGIAQEAATNFGVDFINDISAGAFDPKMFETVAQLDIPYIMMHIQGTPATMQQHPTYDDLMGAITDYFAERIHRLRMLGVMDIVIDPGFGFGKTIEHNYELLRRMEELQIFELPLLVGMSRKAMIYKLLETDAQHALNGTTVVNTLALLHGADILRVHDVREAVECVKIVEAQRKR